MEIAKLPDSNGFRLWLQLELQKRCRKNPQYSLRAFATFLQIDVSILSRIIAGKRKASAKVINHICERLSASPIQHAGFLKEINGKKLLNPSPTTQDEFLLIAEDSFALISDWYHAAILELTFTKSFQNDYRWIAKSLSITVSEAKIALERLIRLGLLQEIDGKLIKTNKQLTNYAGVTTSATKEFQRQIIGQAQEAVNNCEPHEKDITSMTMAIDENKLPMAREIIKNFRRELCALLEEGEQTRVYNLAIQLFPISKKTNDTRELL